jgi:hypothetical protein
VFWNSTTSSQGFDESHVMVCICGFAMSSVVQSAAPMPALNVRLPWVAPGAKSWDVWKSPVPGATFVQKSPWKPKSKVSPVKIESAMVV